MNIQNKNQRVRIFTWHIHGSYLYYLTQANCEFYIPYKKDQTAGYAGKTKSFPWGDNVHEVPVEDVKKLDLDIILFQSNYGSKNHFLEDQYKILSEKQRALPKIYLEHDPPRGHPTDTKHMVDDPNILLVHVTYFNKLMWDNNRTPTTVIEHGVMIPASIQYSGILDKGVVMINNLALRGRRLGADIFKRVQKEIPLDLIGMGSKEMGGIGEVSHDKLPQFLSRYRFFFNPIRYTSLGLAVCEAMMVGLPIVSLATTEMPAVITNDISGYIDTDINKLVVKMQFLLNNSKKAKELSKQASAIAKKRFNINRFTKEWENIFRSRV